MKVKFKNGFGAIFIADLVGQGKDKWGKEVFEYANPKIVKLSTVDFEKANDLHSNILLGSHIIEVGEDLKADESNGESDSIKAVMEVATYEVTLKDNPKK
jgi:hypothetical protein